MCFYIVLFIENNRFYINKLSLDMQECLIKQARVNQVSLSKNSCDELAVGYEGKTYKASEKNMSKLYDNIKLELL